MRPGSWKLKDRAALSLEGTLMDGPGARYRVLAARCRQSAESSAGSRAKGALLQMALAYERRATDVEREWRQRISAERITERT